MIQSKLKVALITIVPLLLTLLFFWKILLTNLILAGVDTFLYFYPYKAYVAEALGQGRLPLWNPHLFMGVPLLANSQMGLFYPLNWPLLWLDAPKQVAWSIGLHIGLAGLFMLAYTRRSLQLGWAGALIAAIVFAFGGYLGAQVEHINQLNAAVWLPLLFLLYDLALARPRRRWFWFLWLGLGVAVTLLAGHAQTVFISISGLGLYGLWRAFHLQPSPLKPVLVFPRGSVSILRATLAALGYTLLPLVLVFVLALALAAVQLLPTAELSALSIRGDGLTYREAVSFSVRPTILHYVLLPPLGLDLSQVLGEAFGEWVAYIGLSGLVLAVLGGIRSVWQPIPRRFLFLAGSGLVLSLGAFTGPLYLALYYLVPGFNLFRVPARWLLLYAFGVAILAGFGFETLLKPGTLRIQLVTAWFWLRTRWWRWILFGVWPLAGLLALIVWKRPPATVLGAWTVALLLAGSLIFYLLRSGPSSASEQPRLAGKSLVALTTLGLLLLTELFWAAQTLNYNHPTAPQAYHSMRNAVAFLLAVDPPGQEPGPPGRFLSLSGTTYDPGDLRELEQIYGDSLSARGLYKLLVATKEKEVLFYNLPLVYNLHSVDGYDGGILPLERFLTLQHLFLPADQLSLDGRLRENLRFVPEGRLLSMLNTRWIVTDKQFDVWIDDLFFDLQFPARLSAGQRASTTDIPDFPATAIGLVSHLEGGGSLPEGTVVAELELTFADGTSQTFAIRAGEDTAEGRYPPDAAHRQARIGVAWPYEAQGVDYVTVYPLDGSSPITRSSLTATGAEAVFVLRGLSLINQPTTTSRSVILSTVGAYRQVHSGDVKIYENLDVLPRAFIVHQAQVVPDEQTAISTMQDSSFKPADRLVRVGPGNEQIGLQGAGLSSLQEQATIIDYQPERIKVAVTLDTPGWLVLTDTYYPGWQASVDGRSLEIFPANLMFRGVALPAGNHTVLFEFKPQSLQIGSLVTGLALLLLSGGLVVASRNP